MALKVKAKEQYQNIGKYAGKYRYVMMPELYTALTQDKVIKGQWLTPKQLMVCFQSWTARIWIRPFAIRLHIEMNINIL